MSSMSAAESLGASLAGKDWLIKYADITLEKEIGRGAYGKVFRATYLGTDVAVKKIANIDDDEVQMLTEREVTFLRSCRHPNIVQFMGVCQHSSGFYIVTEYVPRGAVCKWLKDDKIEISWPMRVRMASDVARAMAYLHSKNVIHRDLKSANLLLDENVRVKVCDFGLAREYDPDNMMSIAGTDAWIAPEILLGLDYDKSADVFSFGVVMCELITRKKPSATLMKRVMPTFAMDLTEVKSLTPSDCPRKFLQLAIDCMASDPKARPTFQMVIDRLKALESDLPKVAPSEKARKKSAASGARPKGGRSSGTGRSRKGRGGSSAQTMVFRFQVQKRNKLGSKQSRVLEVNLAEGHIRNFDQGGEMQKQFLASGIKAVNADKRDKMRAKLEFHPKLDQRLYDLDFVSEADRDSFIDKVHDLMQLA